MCFRQKITFLLLIICSQVINAQVFVGENVYISEGTEISIKNEDVVLASTVSGKGKIVLQNTGTKKSLIKVSHPDNLANVVFDDEQYYAVKIIDDKSIQDKTTIRSSFVEREIPRKLVSAFVEIIPEEGFYLLSVLKFPEIKSKTTAKYSKKAAKQNYSPLSECVSNGQNNIVFATFTNNTILYIFYKTIAHKNNYARQEHYKFTVVNSVFEPPRIA